MNNELLLLSGEDIPFVEAQITIHQPRIKEIAMIGEEAFLSACQFIMFSKNQLSAQDKIGLEDKSDFEIIMSIMSDKTQEKYKNYISLLFTLLFPEYQNKFSPNEIFLFNSNFSTRINIMNFDILRDIIDSMFGLKEDSDGTSGDYNPVDKRSAKIAEKLAKGKQKVAQLKGNAEKVKKVAIFSRYISILSVGEQKNMNDFMNYTVFQLKDEFKRYQKKQSYDIYIQAKMAGATGLDDVDNWMDDIHP